ncbi:solute carrier family 13 member 2-like isoform X1 [Pomacea canaliculata]|uniref:solute carrier family 13 member 2-like isoform X1 n=1 Tax=Pomacea canaliculata TaxID=400727 RepID=UPI000D726CCB|nr:solute carrier family 13 member 2-like isoform X1 [Pomacea canaliculata]
MDAVRNTLTQVWAVRQTVVFVVTPLAFLPLIFQYDSQEAKCAYALALMAVYWLTEALPLPVTALLPVVLFPLLGVMPVAAVCKNYIKDASMFGIGGLTFAIAIESSNLHKRIALRILLLMGSDPMWLMLGFMLPTWFMSMWVSNTSSTALMIPVVTAVLDQLKDTRFQSTPPSAEINANVISLLKEEESDKKIQPLKGHDDAVHLPKDGTGNAPTPMSLVASPARYKRICKGMSLCIAYAANIGGTGSLSGTSPNLIMQGQAQGLFQEYGLDSGVNFTSWIIFALPGSAICLFLTWMVLSCIFFGPRNCIKRSKSKVGETQIKNTIRQQYEKLGPVTFAEKVVMGHFLVLISLWVSRNPPETRGWGSLFPPGFVGDSAAAILVAVSLFVFPAERPQVFWWRKDDSVPRAVRSVMTWETLQKNYPWGVLLLLGGGYALASACEESGLSRWIGDQLTVFSSLSPWQLALVLSGIIAMATEVTSNTATASLLVPILGQLALNLGLNPLYLLFPCTIATSFAFMLPVATPPNTLVFSTGHLEVKDMVVAGFFVNILCVLVVNMAANTWGMAYFRFDVLPVEMRAAVNNSLRFTTGTSNESDLHSVTSRVLQPGI